MWFTHSYKPTDAIVRIPNDYLQYKKTTDTTE